MLLLLFPKSAPIIPVLDGLHSHLSDSMSSSREATASSGWSSREGTNRSESSRARKVWASSLKSKKDKYAVEQC